MGALFFLSFTISRAIAAKKTLDILKERANYATQRIVHTTRSFTAFRMTIKYSKPNRRRQHHNHPIY